jgi:phosphoglycerate dehydrogenase-like enzyme
MAIAAFRHSPTGSRPWSSGIVDSREGEDLWNVERLSKTDIIGLRNIGRPVAVCLLKTGFTLTILDVTPEVQQVFVGFHGARSAFCGIALNK